MCTLSKNYIFIQFLRFKMNNISIDKLDEEIGHGSWEIFMEELQTYTHDNEPNDTLETKVQTLTQRTNVIVGVLGLNKNDEYEIWLAITKSHLYMDKFIVQFLSDKENNFDICKNINLDHCLYSLHGGECLECKSSQVFLIPSEAICQISETIYSLSYTHALRLVIKLTVKNMEEERLSKGAIALIFGKDKKCNPSYFWWVGRVISIGPRIKFRMFKLIEDNTVIYNNMEEKIANVISRYPCKYNEKVYMYYESNVYYYSTRFFYCNLKSIILINDKDIQTLFNWKEVKNTNMVIKISFSKILLKRMNEIWNKIATDQKFEFHNESKSKQTIVKTVENKVTNYNGFFVTIIGCSGKNQTEWWYGKVVQQKDNTLKVRLMKEILKNTEFYTLAESEVQYVKSLKNKSNEKYFMFYESTCYYYNFRFITCNIKSVLFFDHSQVQRVHKWSEDSNENSVFKICFTRSFLTSMSTSWYRLTGKILNTDNLV